MKARERGAKLIHVDPRFGRTSAVSDLHVPIRAGTDIAFLGGFIKYALDNNRINREYLVHFTNAPFLIHEGFKLPEDGLYSGFDPEVTAGNDFNFRIDGFRYPQFRTITGQVTFGF